jgi:uncharacterized protein (TIGR01319 family)
MSPPRPILALDIGSTWTKGALFLPDRGRLVVQREGATPTTTDDLCRGFWSVCEGLVPGAEADPERLLAKVELAYTSSAKGGLSIAASGIVPDLTAQAAKEAALSAGAKVTRVFSYRLTSGDLADLARDAPDILLVCGGTDGGNESIVRHNVAVIASSQYQGVVLFAGNRTIAEEVRRTLLEGGKECVVADNVLPNLERPRPESAHEAIKEIFLSRIITGKGLSRLVDQTGQTPLPTPLAMLSYVETLHRCVPELGSFCLVDLGGATTDYYSASPAGILTPGAMLRGLPEPPVKRTVDGDLGMRVSAASLVEAVRHAVPCMLGATGGTLDELQRYVAFLANHPEHLPVDERESELDALLALCAVRLSAWRHAGRMETVLTPSGPVFLQKGKDLRVVTTLIGTGGYLSHAGDRFFALDLAPPALDEFGRDVLAAPPQRIFVDGNYRFPLLAAASRIAPDAAAVTGVESLTLMNGLPAT